MYGPDSIRARLREEPFRPVRIIATEGLRFDIHHPDLVMIGTRDITIGIPTQEGGLNYSKQIRVAYVHIVALEELTAQPA